MCVPAAVYFCANIRREAPTSLQLQPQYPSRADLEFIDIFQRAQRRAEEQSLRRIPACAKGAVAARRAKADIHIVVRVPQPGLSCTPFGTRSSAPTVCAQWDRLESGVGFVVAAPTGPGVHREAVVARGPAQRSAHFVERDWREHAPNRPSLEEWP